MKRKFTKVALIGVLALAVVGCSSTTANDNATKGKAVTHVSMKKLESFLLNSTNTTITDWGSGTSIEKSKDASGNEVYYTKDYGNGWGGPSSCVAFTKLEAGFASQYKTLNFKVKSANLNSIFVKFPNPDEPTEASLEIEQSFDIKSGKYLGGGWYQMQIPLKDFKFLSEDTEFGIHGGWSNGGNFYLSEVTFK